MAPRIPLPSHQRNSINMYDTRPLSPEYDRARMQVFVELSKLSGIDPVTQEVVRMLNARHQGCNL
jgi:hypothetical protein